MSEKRVLVVGGLGYLGQHLLQSLSSELQGSPYEVAVTYHSTPPPQSLLDALPPSFSFFQVDLRTGSGFDDVSLKFGQWIDGVLSKGDKAEFFHDEYRCPVYVKDVVSVILTLTNRWVSGGKQMQMLLNLGGPDRVSRVQMAEVVADVRGYDTTLIKQVSASSVNRGVKSPADISMDITKLVQTLNIHPVTFRDGIKLTLAAEAKQ